MESEVVELFASMVIVASMRKFYGLTLAASSTESCTIPDSGFHGIFGVSNSFQSTPVDPKK